MVEVKYKSVKNSGFLHSLAGYVFKNPIVYFTILLFVTSIILIFRPHTITFYEPSDINVGIQDDFLLTLDKSRPNYFKSFLTINATLQSSSSAQNLSAFKSLSPQCKGLKNKERFDCYPQANVTEETCVLRGCCWAVPDNTSREESVPYCYYPSNFKTYKLVNISKFDTGIVAHMDNIMNSSYPNNIQHLKIDINYIDDSALQVKIYDAEKARFETPFPKILKSLVSGKNTSYTVNINNDKLGFNVVRKSNNQSVFDTEDLGGFIFADQMLQLSARLPSRKLYGLGQQRNNFLLDIDWKLITLFNRDQEPKDGSNLYGTHPFHMTIDENGVSSGVFLHNSNAMDIVLQPLPAITYRTIGGIFDFYIFLGPSPAEVLQQYTKLVGRPFFPPYWSLGFHLCRYGYNSLNETMNVWNRTRASGIPFDTQWNDIDYMQKNNDFTYDRQNFAGLPKFVDLLHKVGMHYTIMTDPGVSAGELPGTYPPYDEGLKEGIFVRDPLEDKPFVTKVWNSKSTVFPDFFHPKAQSYWQSQISQFHSIIPFDGLWIDMNDPSTFIDGKKEGCPNTTLDNPPYLPRVEGGQLCAKTLCMSARHYNYSHYNIHNIFASQETILTSQALLAVRKKRPFIISRSSYPGHGYYSGVWTGDISSSWDDMAHSVSDILSFSLFGIPMSGADICGFNDNTTASLCLRWSQLGAFYPFSRNHNSDENIDQDPVALGSEVVEAARSALLVRYSLLPYLYTLFWHAHTRGDTVARPMFVQFPKDEKTHGIHNQFLWGPALLIAPLLSEEQTYPTAYLPAGRWYDFYLFKPIESKGADFLLPSQPNNIPLLLNGGHIIPTQQPNTTTTASRKNPFGLIVSLCKMGNATGDLYWDDGDNMDYERGIYNYLTLKATGGNLTSEVIQWKYKTTKTNYLAEVKVLGVDKPVTKVEVNGNSVQFSYKSDIKFLSVTNLTVDLSQAFTMTWS